MDAAGWGVGHRCPSCRGGARWLALGKPLWNNWAGDSTTTKTRILRVLQPLGCVSCQQSRARREREEQKLLQIPRLAGFVEAEHVSQVTEGHRIASLSSGRPLGWSAVTGALSASRPLGPVMKLSAAPQVQPTACMFNQNNASVSHFPRNSRLANVSAAARREGLPPRRF